jgi:hypothetical protein
MALLVDTACGYAVRSIPDVDSDAATRALIDSGANG